jgi:hypothetical protein
MANRRDVNQSTASYTIFPLKRVVHFHIENNALNTKSTTKFSFGGAPNSINRLRELILLKVWSLWYFHLFQQKRNKSQYVVMIDYQW